MLSVSACTNADGNVIEPVYTPPPQEVDTEAPSVPADVTATALSESQIKIAWTISTDNTGVAAYTVYRDGSPLDETRVAGYLDTDLSENTDYSYQICAFDSAGNTSGLSLAAVATTTSGGSATGDTYHVGPARAFTTLQQVVAQLQPGDLVLIDGGAIYPGGITFNNSGTPEMPVTIRGLKSGGTRPIIEGQRNVVEFNRNNYVFESIEIRNAEFRGLYHHADNITIRDCVVHDCPHGILGADEGSGNITIEYCEIYHCGEGDGRHQLYISTNENDFPGSIFRLQFCYIHDGTGGNNVKSRAERNEIYYNWLESPYYHNLELIGPDPAGGVAEHTAREDSDVVGNVIIARRYSRNVRIGGDGCGQSYGRYRFVNNTFIHRPDSPRSHIFAHFDVESVEMHNNIFHISAYIVFDDSEASWVYGRRISGTNNWVHSAAGYPAEWTGTITGSDPGLIDMAGHNYLPAYGSIVINAGTSSLSGPDGSPFINPLAAPLFHPPQRMLLPVGTAVPRPANGTIDIGAFEAD